MLMCQQKKMRIRDRHGKIDLTVRGSDRTVAKTNVLYVFKKFLGLAAAVGFDPDNDVIMGPGAFKEYVKESMALCAISLIFIDFL